MRLYRNLIFLYLFLAGALMSNGQTSFSTSEILAGAFSENELSLQKRELDFLKNTNHELPWVNEMEFRTETDEMDWERQEYLFRLSLNSTEEREAQRKFHAKNIALAEIEREQILHESLMDKYALLVKYYFANNELELYAEKKTVVEDRLNVLKKMANANGTLDLLDFITVEDELDNIDWKLNQIKSIQKKYLNALSISNDNALNFENIITINEIKNRIPQSNNVSNNSPEIIQRQTEIEKAKVEYELESAGNKRILDFVQLKYSGRGNLNINQEFSFGMGFNIPYKNADRLDLNELKLEQIENENRLELYILRQAERIATEIEHINLLFESLELAQQQLAESQTTYSLENYPQLADADPLVLLKIKDSELKRRMDIQDIEKDIFEAYLKLLDFSGQVTERPLMNYLSSNLETIENR